MLNTAVDAVVETNVHVFVDFSGKYHFGTLSSELGSDVSDPISIR